MEGGASRRPGRRIACLVFLILNFKSAGKIRKLIYRSRDLAKVDVFECVEMFYNGTRRHSHLGGVSPEVFESASFNGLQASMEPGKSTDLGRKGFHPRDSDPVSEVVGQIASGATSIGWMSA